MKAQVDHSLACRQLFGIVGDTKSNVVNRPRAAFADGLVAGFANINRMADLGPRRVANSPILAGMFVEPEHLQHLCGRRSARDPQRHRVRAAYCMVRRNRSIPPGNAPGIWNSHKLHGKPVRVFECQHRFVKASFAFERNIKADQSVRPEVERGRRHGQGDRRRLSAPTPALAGTFVREKRQQRSRSADLIAVVKVVSLWVVEIDGLLDGAHAEQSRPEVDVTLRIAGDGGDVMDSGGNWHGHGMSDRPSHTSNLATSADADSLTDRPQRSRKGTTFRSAA